MGGGGVGCGVVPSLRSLKDGEQSEAALGLMAPSPILFTSLKSVLLWFLRTSSKSCETRSRGEGHVVPLSSPRGGPMRVPTLCVRPEDLGHRGAGMWQWLACARAGSTVGPKRGDRRLWSVSDAVTGSALERGLSTEEAECTSATF